MRRFVQTLSSLKLTVVLILLLGVVLAAGTIKESLHGTEAGRAVYYSPWFFAMQGLFCLNLIAALVDRWPRNRWRVGFAITHLSMVVIFLGAVATYVYKVEGQIALWEGETTDAITQHGDHGEISHYPLPFQVRLDAFEIDTYQGTMRPAMFRSRVTVVDKARGVEMPAVIEMNQPLAYGGFHFFQSSYNQSGGREMSVLSVSRDPGQAIAFAGYGLLVLGMCVVFATRLAQARATAEAAAAKAARPASGAVARAAAAALLLALALVPAAQAAQVPDAAVAAGLRSLPVQHDGRTMPLETQAREAVWKITGLRAWPGIEPVAMVLGWTADPNGWVDQPIVKVGDAELAARIGLPAGTRWATFRTLASSGELQQIAREAAGREMQEQKPTSLDKAANALNERLGTLEAYFRGDALRVVPGRERNDAWSPLPSRDPAALANLATQLRSGSAPVHYPTVSDIDRELQYNHFRLPRWAWLFLLGAAVAAAATVDENRLGLRPVAALGLLGGFVAMSWNIWLRWQIAGRVPASNMYESMLFLAWGVGLFGLVALLLRNRLLIANAAGMGALAMLLVDLLPMDGFIHPVMPVLANTYWLAIHVPIIVISYSVLAMGTGLAHMVLGIELFAPARRDLAERWSQLLYWYLHVGSILLIAGILTGSIWAASSWGRYWGWDPKEVWSLIAFLAYMAILHAKFDLQIRSFGVAAFSILAFWTILMTYLGVNYVLATGLHAYGFGSSNLVRIMVLIAAAEGAFLLAAWSRYRRSLAAQPQAA